MQIYHYHAVTREFIGVGAADEDPLTPGAHLLPAFSTPMPPPPPGAKQIAVFDGHSWSLVSDYRGETWWTPDRQPTKVIALGDPSLSGLLRTRPPLSAEALNQMKAEARMLVDDQAERQRLKRITGGAAKAMEYMEAKDQAVAVIQMGEAAANALPNGGVSEFPVLAASVGTEAPSLFAAAQLIIGRYEAYAALAGAIKRKVIETKSAIDAATSEDAVRAALDSVQWP